MAGLNACLKSLQAIRHDYVRIADKILAVNVRSSLFHTTSKVERGKRKVKVATAPRLVKMIEDGATEDEVQAFVEMRAAKREATSAYKAKMEDIAGYFRQQYRLEEERKKDIEGEQMKRQAEEKEAEAMNIALILKNNEELKRERELRNLIQAERRQKDEETQALEQMEQDELIFEKRRALVLQVIEESKDFVTKENLDEKITYVLENEVNYNFALTPDGKKLYSTKQPGNFDQHNWKGASPAAYYISGHRFGEWDFLFEHKYATTIEEETDARKLQEDTVDSSKVDEEKSEAPENAKT